MAKCRLGILYYEKDPKPIALFLKDRIFCWREIKEVDAVFINLAFTVPHEYINRSNFDALILDTTLLRRRWTDDEVKDTLAKISTINTQKPYVVAVPQDEYSSSAALFKILRAAKCDLVLTCCNKNAAEIIYPAPRNFELQQILTCYVSKRLRKVATKPSLPIKLRPIPVSYRSKTQTFAHGTNGLTKDRLGKKFLQYCNRNSISHDIKFGTENWLNGKKWLKQLQNSQCVLGAPSGASIVNCDGKLEEKLIGMNQRERREFYENPDFKFSGKYQKIDLSVIGPRHIEAACFGTPQILIVDSYNDLFKPAEHYVPIKPDFSNIEDVFHIIGNHKKLKAIAQRMRLEVLNNPLFCQTNYCKVILVRIRQKALNPITLTAKLSTLILKGIHFFNRRSLDIQRCYQTFKSHLKPAK